MLDLLLPPRCVGCRRPGAGLCTSCALGLPPAPDLASPPGLAACWSLLEHRDAGRDVVLALKYAHHHDAVRLLAAAMATLVDERVDGVTWAPTSARRRRTRGFDQAELLARAVARHLGVRCRRTLTRDAGAPQSGRDRRARLDGPAFTATRHAAGAGRVLLVDDVRTTGATLCAAADALTAAGAARVLGLTLSVRP